MFEGTGKPLSETGLSRAAGDLGVGLPALWAVMTVETMGCGFLPDRRPLVLFERHIFHNRTQGRFDGQAPDLSNPKAGGYEGGEREHKRLERAVVLDRKAALESVSWGLGQVMGFNAASVGFVDVEAMVKAMFESEDAQFQAMVGFITANGLAKHLQQENWEAFARGYNGPAYEKNDYHNKLRRENARFVQGPLPDLSLRSAQLALTYLGYNPGPVDGWFGKKTGAALTLFQKSKGLAATGQLDDATKAALAAA